MPPTDRPPASSILIVDDNPQNLSMLTKILTQHGYSVRPAINGEVALTVANSLIPDIILLDIRMPDLDGYQVCERLKADRATRDIPIIFLSALDDALDKVRAFDVGGVDYVTKPFQADEILARVATHINLRALQTQLEAQNAELTTYRRHLEDLVEQRTAELQHANTRLEHQIRQQQEAERALQLSERQYRLLAESVTDGIVIVQNGRIALSNAAFATLLGSPADAVKTREVSDLFPGSDDVKLEQPPVGQPARSAPRTWQREMTTPNGRSQWIEATQTHLMWENAPATLLTVKDITDRKLRELHLEEEQARLRQENLTLKSSMTERYRFGQLVGKSQAMQRVYELITSAATSEANVLVVGESGTGKELTAKTIHQMSARRDRPFLAVNCASIPETLFEREFFGHRRGTFTGADRDASGLFDRAHQGTLFLDEVTELTPGAQAKLLRVLQDGEYFPLGSTQPNTADVHIVAATNQNPRALIEQGALREDFFYRVCVIEIRLPALRERKEDLPLLIEHILRQYHAAQQARHNGRLPAELPANAAELPGDMIRALHAYHWPGNVRELHNMLQRYLATLNVEDVLALLGAERSPGREAVETFSTQELRLPEAVAMLERRMIADGLANNRYRIGKTADALGISVRSLQYKMQKYGLRDT